MSTDVEKVYLNEKAFPFVLKQFRTNDLSTQLTELFLNSKVEIWTLGSVEMSEQDLIEFEFGGKFNYEKARDWATELVTKNLNNENNNDWIIIDHSASVKYTVEQNEIEGSVAFYFKDTVLYLLKDSAIPLEAIKETFKFGGWYPFIGFITKITPSIKEEISHNNITADSIEYIVKNISLIVIGAYDEESYIVLELSEK